ncbi:MAG: phosphoribosylanthranilate isomerase [Nitrospirae bacterium]|nr:phosphoribosylanthranilate isomerase [Nitrospirota bacterium]
MVKVKICGITNTDDAMAAVEAGADALGFIFVKESPRYIDPREAGNIIRRLPTFVKTAGVFVNEPVDVIDEIVTLAGIDLVQLHGEESPELCRRIHRGAIKVIRVKSLESLGSVLSYKDHISALLLDTYSDHMHGGTGQVFNWDIAVEAKKYFHTIILSGGLTPDNISDAIKYVGPYAVDVSGGVESAKGKKDHAKLRLFIERAKSAI